MKDTVRTPAVAGTFYPARRDELLLTVMMQLNECEPQSETPPKALVVPHAGYIFSGAVAAAAFKHLEKWRGRYKRVVLLGAAHRAAVEGIAVPSCGWFSTPLGTVRVDEEYIARITAAGLAKYDDDAHRFEHSLEVQLPFLQRMLPDTPVVPVLVGRLPLEKAVQFLHSVWGGESTLVIVSTDLSHYLPAAQAGRADRLTRRKIALLDPAVDVDEACASLPLNALLYVAHLKGLRAGITAHCHSGERSGDNSRVVGYVSAVFVQDEGDSGVPGTVLLRLARAAVASAWYPQRTLLFPDFQALHEPGATFVTLTKNGSLRGCIGSLQAYRALKNDVQENAVAAAFSDPRFPRLDRRELEDICIEVSLLSQPEPLIFDTEEELLAALRPGTDGLILSWNGRRGTFLPQVWEQLPEPREFLRHLKNKAGLTADFWAEDITVQRYTVQKWKESDFGG